jgi:hypothetical protein
MACVWAEGPADEQRTWTKAFLSSPCSAPGPSLYLSSLIRISSHQLVPCIAMRTHAAVLGCWPFPWSSLPLGPDDCVQSQTYYWNRFHCSFFFSSTVRTRARGVHAYAYASIDQTLVYACLVSYHASCWTKFSMPTAMQIDTMNLCTCKALGRAGLEHTTTDVTLSPRMR